MEVHPEVVGAGEGDAGPSAVEEAQRADLRRRLRRAESRRRELVSQVSELRDQVSGGRLSGDVEGHQRAQDALVQAMRELERAEAQVERLRRALDSLES